MSTNDENARVRVRVNVTAAGVGEHGQVLDTDDSPLLRGMARHGVVTILTPDKTTEGAEYTGGLMSGRLPDEPKPVELDEPAPAGDRVHAPESEPAGEQEGGDADGPEPEAAPRRRRKRLGGDRG